ncbi:helix-turn-helix domain-containing protein [Robinsoniella peoriensis]|uniref:helix-turn-helix domain-containing protein n=1 Tax=Robinsoniella peoriensis TaxID=180332 RepID=UPI00085BF863|nr:helix-turn-helix transcriptional regulator [Robinsoniella peoriensis]
MTIGDRIKYIRTFRGLTQKELGLRIGLDVKSADNRIAQYETNYRVPKKDMLEQIASALDVNSINFIGSVPGCAEDIMQTFFWLDEDNRGMINLFQLVRNSGKTNATDDTSVRYNDNDDWPAHAPVGLWFDYGLVNDYMKEWLKRKEELKAKEITNDEYLEWKLNWPNTCDDCGKFKPNKKWRVLI